MDISQLARTLQGIAHDDGADRIMKGQRSRSERRALAFFVLIAAVFVAFFFFVGMYDPPL